MRINLVPTKSGEHGLYVIYRENFDLFAVQLWRLSPKWNLSVERVNEETFKVTDGEMCRVPASHGQWGSYDATRALAWITRTAPNAWLARCNNQACGPSSFNKAKARALEMASGAIGDYFVSDPVRELNEPQSNPGLGYKPPKREVTPDGDSGLGGEGTLDGTMRQHQGSFELTE